MGITIHYRGRLRRKEDLETLTNEVQDLCTSAQWKHHVWDGTGDKQLHGISFQTHPESEWIWMTFDNEGIMHNFFSIDDPTNFRDEEGYPYNSTKTQFAGVEAHIVVCKLLRFIGDKYFEDWKVLDEGMYYETSDVAYLTKVMNLISDAINDLSESLENISAKEGQSLEQYISEVAQKFRDRNLPPETPNAF